MKVFRKTFGPQSKNNMIALWTFLVLAAVMFPSGVFGAPAHDSGTTFKDAEDKEWILSDVRSAGKTIHMDRQKLEADNLGGVYTAVFRKEQNSAESRLSGMGAPNRYFAPYTAGSNRTLRIGLIAGTMMLAFREPGDLKEGEFFALLSKVTRWDLREGKLELYSSGGDGAETTLIFAIK